MLTKFRLPVDEGAFGVHEVEFVVQSRPGLGDGGRVGEHADGATHRGLVRTRYARRRLVVDSNLNNKHYNIFNLIDRILRASCKFLRNFLSKHTPP